MNTNTTNTNTNNTQNQSPPQHPSSTTDPTTTTTTTFSNPFASSSSSPPPSSSSNNNNPVATGSENWGTHIMGTPAVPSSHPDNKKAALHEPPQVQYYQHQHDQQHPYVQHSPVEKPSNSPMESILHMFDSWSKKAEATANNIWHNREFPLFLLFHLLS